MGSKTSEKFYLSAWDVISCARGVYYKKKKFPLPFLHPEIVKIKENYARAAEAGMTIQKKLRKKWLDEHILLSAENRIPNDWGILCKFDALCDINGRLVLYEIKGVSGDFFERIRRTGEPRKDNRIQIILYHHFMSSKYPDLKPVLLYVNRKDPAQTIEVPVQYSEEELESVHDTVLRLRDGIEKEIPPEPAGNIIFDTFEKRYMVNPVAITCDYHGICSNDDYWYPNAEEEVERLNNMRDNPGS